MTKFVMQGFSGTRPKLSQRLLADNDAVVAENARIETGEVFGWNNPSSVHALSGATPRRTIYNFGTAASPNWLSWATDVDVAKSPIVGNVDHRTYYTGDGVPKTINDALVAANSWYQLGLPAPVVAPTLAAPALNTSGTVDGNMTRTTAIVTFDPPGTIFTQNSHSADTFARGATSAITQRFLFSKFVIGTVLNVKEVLDDNTFVIEELNGGVVITEGDTFEAGWLVEPYSAVIPAAVHGHMSLPSGMHCTITNHGLRKGDTLTVTAVSVVPQWDGWRGKLTTGSTASLTGPQEFTPQDATGNVSFDVYTNWSFSVQRDQAAVAVREYVFTWVTDLSEESAPSLPTDPLLVMDGDAVTISGFGTAPSTDRVISKIRIYRTVTGTNATAFQFVAEINAGVGTYIDTLLDTELGEILPSDAWDPPPSDLIGIISTPTGFMAGFSGNMLCFSEPDYPHAWPTEYRFATDWPIVGIAQVGQTVFAMTEAMPYAASGIHPRNIALRRIEAHEACVSKQSIVVWAGYAYYASPNGLIKINEYGPVNLTAELYTREQWQALTPSTIDGKIHNGRYIGVWGAPGAGGIFILDLSKPQQGIETFSGFYYGGYTEPSNGDLYLSDGGNVVKWNGGTTATVTWKSKVFGATGPMNLGAARVLATAYPVTLNVYDAETSTLIAARTIANAEPTRLPNGKLYNQFQFEVVFPSSTSVKFVAVAETLAELSDT